MSRKWVAFWFLGLLLISIVAMWTGAKALLAIPLLLVATIAGRFTKGNLGQAIIWSSVFCLLVAVIWVSFVWKLGLYVVGAVLLIVIISFLRWWRRKSQAKARQDGKPLLVKKERKWVAVIFEYFFPVLLLTFLSLVAKAGGFSQFFRAFEDMNYSVFQAMGKSMAVVFVGWVIAWGIIHKFTTEKGNYKWIWLAVCVLGILVINQTPFVSTFGTPGSDEMGLCLEGGPIPNYTLPVSASKFYQGGIPVRKAGDTHLGYNLVFGQWIAVMVEGELEDKFITDYARLRGKSVKEVSWDSEAALYPTDFGHKFRQDVPCPRQVFGGPVITLQHQSGVQYRWEPAFGHKVKFALYKVLLDGTLVSGVNLPRSRGVLATIQRHTGTENGGPIGQYIAFYGPGTKSSYRITVWLVPPPTAEQLASIKEYARQLAY
ncbi:MAG: hypothetical protein V2A65_10660 [Candidatus Omnitrophota bacterium]